MNRKMYYRTLLPLLVILSLLLAAVHTTPVYAQGEEPPGAPSGGDEPSVTEPAENEQPETEPTGNESGEGEQPAAEPPATEQPAAEPPVTEPVEGETVGAEQPVVPPTESELPAQENNTVVAAAVEALAEGDLVLVDAQGEALPLASQEAAQVLVSSDPYFYHASCAGGKCSYLNFADALLDFAAKSASGYIYVEGAISGVGGVYAENVNIDGSAAGYGGLSGLLWRDAEGADVAGETLPTINGSVTIANFTHAFDLYGLRITNGLTLDNITGNIGLNTVSAEGGSGIDITDSSGTVNLLWSGATSSTDDGIHISNHSGNVNLYRAWGDGNHTYGARIDATGTVKISNSTFDYNGTDNTANDGGLFVTNSAAISLVGVSASQNLGNGAYFDEVNAGLTVRNSIFNHNADPTLAQGFGLWANNAGNKGNLTFESVVANDNDQGNWTLQTNGNISLKTVEGNGSQTGYGASLQTLGAGTVNILNADFNNNNSGYGLNIASNGNVTLDGAFTINNGLYGARINNASLPAKTVTVLASGFGGSLGGNGLEVNSSGMITLNGVSAWNNSSYGIYLLNTAGPAGITFLNTLGGNGANNNQAGGLYARTKGALLLTGMDVSSNQNYGADLDNCLWNGSACIGMGAVTITQSNFNGTWHDDGTAAPAHASGLWVQTKGIITLNSVSVSDSQNGTGTVGVAGAELYNNFAGATTGVSILNTLGGNRFSWNQGGAGLTIASNGLVSLSGVDADNNSGDGVNIDNSSGTAGVSLPGTANGWSRLNENGGDGLEITTRGAVTLNRIETTRNSGGGVKIDNDGGTAGVTISSGRFNQNSGDDGLNVSSKGAIKLTDIEARENAGSGAVLDNHLGTAGVTIAVSPNSGNSLNNNGDHGLYVRSKGAVLVNNLNAGNNGINGVDIDTCIDIGASCTAKGNVTLANAIGWWSWLGENTGVGLKIVAGGSIAATRVNADNNDLMNASLTAYGLGTISLLQGNFNNGLDGLYAAAAGMVTLNNIQVNDNDNNGAYILSGNSIALLNTLGGNDFNNNAAHGLDIVATGTVTLNQINVENNERGAFIEANNNVTINNSSFARNKGEAGLWVQNTGTITLNQTGAYENGVLANDDPEDAGSTWAYGAMLDNSSSTTAKTVAINRGWFNNNYGDGLDVRSKGNVLLDGIDANNNFSYHKDGVNNVYHHGVAVSSDGALTMSSKLSGNNLNNNSGNGLNAYATGKITLTNAYAQNNGGSGFVLASLSDALLTNLQAHNNADSGLTLTTNGQVTVNLSGFSNNTDYNALIDNTGAAAAAPKNVTITGSGFNSSSGGYGLQVLSDGVITLTSVTTFNNRGGNGATLNNSTGTTAGVIVNTAKAYTYFGQNSANGLQISTNGAVTLSNLRTDRNDSSGLVVNTPAAITITNMVAIQNGVHGANLTAGGIVTIDKLSAFENGRDGNSANGTGYGLKITTSNDNAIVRNSAFSGNGEYGVWVNLGAGSFLDFYATTWVGNNRDGGTGNVFISSGSWRIFTIAAP